MRVRNVGAVLATLFSAAAFYLSGGVGRAWPLAWLAPLPVLLHALGAPAPWRALRVLAAGSIAYAAAFASLVPVYGGLLPGGVLAGAIAQAGLAYGVTVWVFSWLWRRLGGLGAALGFASLWTAIEWLQSLVSPDGTAGSLATSQAMVPALIQSAALLGQYALTWLLCFVPAALAVSVERRRAGAPLAIAGVALSAALALNLREPRPTGEVLPLGLASSDAFPDAFDAATLEEAMAPLDEYAGAVALLARQGAALVLLPERITTLRAEWDRTLRERLASLARENKVDLVVGVGDFTCEPPRNVALAFDERGDLVATYTKRHLVPGLESQFVPGDARAVLAGGRALAVCKDLDFQDVARDYGGEILVLVAPAWDFGADAELHQRMATLRAVEGGFALVRSAREGLMTVQDLRGRVLAIGHSASPVATLRFDLPLARRPALFPAIGNAFPLAALLLATTLVVAALRTGRRNEKARDMAE